MSVMMGFGAAQQGPGGGAPPAHAELMYGPPPPGSCGGLGSHPLSSVHDSGIEMSPHDMDPSTQEIEYHDASSSSDSRASFSDLVSSMSADDYSSESGGGPGIGIPTGTRGGPSMAMDKRPRARRRRSPPKATFDFNDNSLLSVYTFFKTFLGASTASTVAIDNKIEQAMDLVKSHLMFAVREEVDVLKDRIVELMDRIKHLECENTILRQYASPEVLQQIQSQLPHQLQQPPHHSSTS